MLKISFCFLFFLGISYIIFASDEYIIEERFDLDKIGKPPQNCNPTNVGVIEVVEKEGQKEDRCVCIMDQGSGGGMSYNFDPLKSGVVSLEFDFLETPGGTGGRSELLYVTSASNASVWSGVCLVRYPDGAPFAYHDKGWIISDKEVDVNIWRHFMYVMDLDGWTYDLYFEEDEVVSSAAFRDHISKSIDVIHVGNVGDGGTTSELYYDNIVMYEGTENPKSLEFKGKLAVVWGKIKSAF